jgi:hypothetical protein
VLRRHRIPTAEFDSLAGGVGDLSTVRAGQLSKRILLVQALVETILERQPDLAAQAGIAVSATVLRTAHRNARPTVDDLLSHPQVGIWGMRLLRTLLGPEAHAEPAGPGTVAGSAPPPRTAPPAGIVRAPGATPMVSPGTGAIRATRSRPAAGTAATRRAHGDEHDGRTTLAAQLGYVGTLAATAALRAGLPCDLTAHTVEGALMFPTIGLVPVAPLSGWVRLQVRFPAAPGADQDASRAADATRARAVVTVRAAAGSVRFALGRTGGEAGRWSPVEQGAEPWATDACTAHAESTAAADADAAADAAADVADAAGGWTAGGRSTDLGARWTTLLPLRRLRAETDGCRLDLDLDDVDPFRNFQRVPAAPRLDTAELARWQTRLDEAWRLLVRQHRASAERMRDALLALVPLRAGDDAAEELSASSADAFGGLALTFPHSGLALAATLVHELAHSRLSALLDLVPLLVPLSAPQRAPTYYAPWRRDPRPLPGLLQGAYAFLALTDFWNAHRATADEAARRLAGFEYARWRAELGPVLDDLERSGCLTDLGARFVAGMRARLTAIGVDDPPVPEARLAATANLDHRITWRLRNVEPDPRLVADLTAAWLAGRPCPGGADQAPGDADDVRDPRNAAETVRPGTARFTTHARLGLTHLRLREPERFAALAVRPDGLVDAIAGALGADVLLALDEPAAAARSYAELIRHAPDRIDLWAGLALARLPRHGAVDPLVRSPERVRALHAALQTRGGPAPGAADLADWMAPGAPGPSAASS